MPYACNVYTFIIMILIYYSNISDAHLWLSFGICLWENLLCWKWFINGDTMTKQISSTFVPFKMVILKCNINMTCLSSCQINAKYSQIYYAQWFCELKQNRFINFIEACLYFNVLIKAVMMTDDSAAGCALWPVAIVITVQEGFLAKPFRPVCE